MNARKSRAAWLSVLSNSALIVLKLVVGVAIGSVAVISEAVHSAVDLVASVITLFAVRKAGRPADRGHSFGHGKYENVSGAVEGLLIFLAAGWIVYESVGKLLHPQPIGSVSWGVGVMLVSTVVNVFVSRFLFRVGRETDSMALIADAWHLRTDVYTSVGVMFGLALLGIGRRLWPGVDLHWVDPVAALLIAVLILRAAYRLTSRAVRDLLDASLEEEEAWISAYLSRLHPPAMGFHRLRTRRSGPVRFIEFHLLVDGAMTVEESHGLTEQVTSEIKNRFRDSTVTVHIEPCDGSCRPYCEDGCLLAKEERLAVGRRSD